MVFNVTFNNMLVISWLSVLLVEETGVTGENHQGTAYPSVAPNKSSSTFYMLVPVAQSLVF
jgi:hypothetical protein